MAVEFERMVFRQLETANKLNQQILDKLSEISINIRKLIPPEPEKKGQFQIFGDPRIVSDSEGGEYQRYPQPDGTWVVLHVKFNKDDGDYMFLDGWHEDKNGPRTRLALSEDGVLVKVDNADV